MFLRANVEGEADVTKSSSAPLYQQIHDDLLAEIRSGVLSEGSKIPSESELSKRYLVSRITVRRAVEDLCSEGCLIKRQGLGTFVASERVQQKLSTSMTPQSFTAICRKDGRVAGARLVSRTIEVVQPEDQGFFGMSGKGLVVHTCRVRTADGVPIFLENIYLPFDDSRRIMDERLDDRSLFDVLDELGRLPASYEGQTIEAVAATSAQASLLAVGVGDPLLYTTMRAHDAGGAPACIGRHYYVGARYKVNL